MMRLGQNAVELSRGIDACTKYNYEEALEIFRPFAEDGNKEAEFLMGTAYYHRGWYSEYRRGWRSSLGPEERQQDHVEAAKWLRKSAEKHLAEAQFWLGRMYQSGEGVERNPKSAYIWFYLASENRYEKARKERDEIGKHLSKEELEDAQRIAKECMKGNYTNCP